jgi:hypothetical protein
MNQIEEQSAKRSSSVTPNVFFAESSASTCGCVMRVGRSNALSARVRRRPQPFALAIASAAVRSSAARVATARKRSRSVGASSSGQVSVDSGRRRVQRTMSSLSNTAWTSSQNGLGSRGVPSSVAASRTR